MRSDGIAGEASVTARATADLDDIIAVNAEDLRVAARLAVTTGCAIWRSRFKQPAKP